MHLVLILDIDGTLIGNVMFQLLEWIFLKKSKSFKRVEFIKRLQNALKSGLMRPGFKKCLNMLNTKYESVELFIYTASLKEWAKLVVEAIEREYDVKFHRPLFTRGDCTGINKKSLRKIVPQIKRCISDVDDASKYKIAMVDNNYVLDKEETRIWSFHKCPTYNKMVEVDILKFIPETYINTHSKEITTVLSHYNIIGKDTGSDFLSSYYTSLGRIIKNRNKYTKDRFWEEFSRTQ